LKFSLRVHAQGDTINGRHHYQDFPTTIKLQGCDNEDNVITNPNEDAWKTHVDNEVPTRRDTNIAIGGFTYSNPYCKLLKYTVEGEDKALITISGSRFTYKSNLFEDFKPRVLVFQLKVHAQGDGINGHTHTQLFPSTIRINGCDKAGVLSVRNAGWVVDRLNENPTRAKETLDIPDFPISIPYCPFSHYSISRDTSR
jgi:hypothetical protein